jgi:hypothetical protein
MGVYKTSPSKMGYQYIVPSENGNRSDCRWVRFESSDGQSSKESHDNIGLMIMTDDGTTNNNSPSSFNFSALLHSADELDKGTCLNEV